MACDKQTNITKHDRFGIFRSRLDMLMSEILKDDAYLYYKHGLFMGMEDKTLSRHYPCHSEMITCSLSAHKHSIRHFLKKLKKTIKACGHWGLYKYLTRAMCKRGEDRMDPFAMDFDENKEMTDNDDSTIDMTPEYMFHKFELVLFLLADSTANLISPQSQLRLQDNLNISDGSVFHIQQEHYKKIVHNMHRYMSLSEKRDADWIVSLMLGQSEALPFDLYMKCKFFEEKGGDLPRCELHSDGKEEECEEPPKSADGDSQGCTSDTASAC